jgi:hypothetical protein
MSARRITIRFALSLVAMCGCLPAASAGAATTSHPTAVVILKLPNQAAPATPTQVMQQVFGVNPPDPYTVKQFWLTQTYGKVNLVGVKNPKGDVFGPYAVKDACDLTLGPQEAQAQGQKHGFSFNAYKTVIWMLPSSCGGGGQGQQPGSQVWVYGLNRYVIDHEMGHNFNSPHASTLRCYSDNTHTTPVTLSTFCDPPVEYGDPFDPMGGGGTFPNCDLTADGGSIPYEMEPWRKLNIGAMSLSSAPTTNVAGTHSHTIAPLENSTGVRMLRLPDGRHDGRMFDLSFRQPRGLFDQWYNHPLDANDDGDPEALNGVLVTWDPKLIASQIQTPLPNSYLLDMTPSTAGQASNPCTSSTPSCDPCQNEPPGCQSDAMFGQPWVQKNPCTNQPMTGFEDAPLAAGKTWSDPRTGLTLTVDSTGSTGARVTITYGHGTVDVGAPTAPGALAAKVGAGGAVSLTWKASVDSIDGVSHYIVTRGGKEIQKHLTTTHTSDKPGAGKHVYTVRAVDTAGNAGPSSSVTVAVK